MLLLLATTNMMPMLYIIDIQPFINIYNLSLLIYFTVIRKSILQTIGFFPASGSNNV